MAKASIMIEKEKCKGCGICVSVCPKGLLFLDESYINLKGIHAARISDINQCIACGTCGFMCPDGVITIEKEE